MIRPARCSRLCLLDFRDPFGKGGSICPKMIQFPLQMFILALYAIESENLSP